MVIRDCSCGGTLTEESPGVDWNDEEDCIWRDDLKCDECGRTFTIFFNFDRLECSSCGEEPKDCECKKEKDD